MEADTTSTDAVTAAALVSLLLLFRVNSDLWCLCSTLWWEETALSSPYICGQPENSSGIPVSVFRLSTPTGVQLYDCNWLQDYSIEMGTAGFILFLLVKDLLVYLRQF